MSEANDSVRCPLCGSSRVEVHHDQQAPYWYLQQEHILQGLEHTKCLDCEGSFFAAGQIERNRERFFDFERRIVKHISPREVRELREKYLITEEEATRIFQCGSPTEFSDWERGETAPSGPTALLLQLALEDVTTMQKLADKAGVKLDEHHQDATHRQEGML